jgi:tetratricopeptide (TPR) repeat protein
VPTAQAITRVEDLPKRAPRPKTCLAFGQLREQEAQEPSLPAGQRELLLEEARKAYHQALQIDGSYLPGYLALAHLYASLGDSERCMGAYQEALRHHPKDGSVWYEMGMSQMRLKQWDAALQELEKATGLDPENRRYAKTYAFCLGRMGRHEESLKILTKLEGEAAAHFQVARMAHHLNQNEISKEHLRLALQAKPDLVEARKLLDALEGHTQVAASAEISIEAN